MSPSEAVADADTALAEPTNARAWRRITLHWTVVVAVLFLLMLLAGLTMRAYQGGYVMGLGPEWFYALLTVHGLGMVGTWYVGAMAGVSYRLARFARSLRSTTSVSFAEGQYVPIAFSVWDGTARERGNRRGITQWFYVYLPPREKPSVVGPILKAAFGVLVLELVVVAALRRRRTAAV